MNNNPLLQSVVVALVVAVVMGAIFLVFLPKATNTIEQVAGSPAGTGTQTAKFFSSVANLATPGANGTSTSILNNTANDFYVTDLKVGCEGVGSSNTAYSGTGLASLTVFAATTSTAGPASSANTNKVGAGNLTIATGTPSFVLASTTAVGGISSAVYYDIWPAGTYLTFFTNATNTAACTFGASVFTS